MLAALAAVVCPPSAVAESAALPPLFASRDEIELTLTLPLRTLLRQRAKRLEVEGTVTVEEADRAPVRLDVEVRTRGRDRLENCAFPPLRLDFKRGQVDGTVFAGQNRLKLVTRCADGERFEQYLELEYFLYGMYEKLTDVAFRVRPARMRYVDTDRDGETLEAPAFLIEPIEGVAERVGMSAVELSVAAPGDFDPRALSTLALFQYLIGNTDWSPTSAAAGESCCHNVDVLAPSDGRPGLVPVPYDFDYAGIVNASYAYPDERLGIRSVRERLYRGYCATNAYLDETIEALNEARPAIEALLQSARLTAGSRAYAMSYLERSYAIVNDDGERQRQIVRRCLGD
jgi:hypothetical protein